MPVIYKINKYLFYFEDLPVGESWLGNSSVPQDLESHPQSETRKGLPQQPPSLQTTDLLAVCCCLLVDAIGMWYKFSLEEYWMETVKHPTVQN